MEDMDVLVVHPLHRRTASPPPQDRLPSTAGPPPLHRRTASPPPQDRLPSPSFVHQEETKGACRMRSKRLARLVVASLTLALMIVFAPYAHASPAGAPGDN